MTGPELRPTDIPGLTVLEPKTIRDERGAVRELFRSSAFREAGLTTGPWLQVNLTESKRGAVRGLHGEQMTKLVGIAAGEAFGVYLDARHASPTLGQVVTVELRVGVQVLVPPGVCNGFQSLTDTQYVYAFDDEWRPEMTGVAVNPLDPALGIEWPIAIDPSDRSTLSAKDAGLPTLTEALSS